MIKRFLIFITVALFALICFKVVANYIELTSLSSLAHYYVDKGPAELGAANLVTAVVVTYRGLDTLGEVTVLFISAAGVGLLLSRRRKTANESSSEETQVLTPHRPASEIVMTATELLLPMVVLFGVYVFLNGHLSPGGGFQGGAIIASGTMFLLLALPNKPLSHLVISAVESISGFAYVVVGILGLMLAGGFLDNRIMGLGDYGALFSAGAIPIIYTFIGLKVGFELSAVLDRFREEEEH